MSIEDKAQEHEAAIWELNNRAREVKTYKPGEPGYGPEECSECGAEMHPVRRADGRTRCTPCQAATEPTARRR